MQWYFFNTEFQTTLWAILLLKVSQIRHKLQWQKQVDGDSLKKWFKVGLLKNSVNKKAYSI